MKPWLPLCMAAIASAASGQVRLTPQRDLNPPTARIEGRVLSDETNAPMRRAHVLLKPAQTGGTTIGVDTDDHGNFEIREIPSGTYSLVAQRDGFLETTTSLHDGRRMPPRFFISKDQKITNVTFRLRPWSILTGKVQFEDGDAGVNVRVDLYRKYHVRGRQGFNIVTSGITDDHGEYRIHGVAPGSYYVAAVYEKPPPSANYKEQPHVDTAGHELPVVSYATTFYPDTMKLSEAVPVRIEYGREVGGIDFSLHPVPKVKLKGQVTDGITGDVISTAAIFLQRIDANQTGTLPLPTPADFDRDQHFTIPGVTSGSYQLWVDATHEGQHLTAARTVTVSTQDIDDLELIAMPSKKWKGTMRVEGAPELRATAQVRVTLEPRNERAAVINLTPNEIPFDLSVSTLDTYDVFVDNLPQEFYVSQIRVNGSDVRALGLAGSLANNLPFEIVLDGRGGQIAGQVFGPNGDAWNGAAMALIPDPAKDRLQSYRETAADDMGFFQIHGIPPGKYILVAWLDDPPCDIYDPDGLTACRAAGMAMDVAPSSQQAVGFTAKTPPR